MIDVIYAEREVLGLPFAEKVISRIPGAAVVTIDRWEDLFYRKKQNYALQKKERKLIIGRNRGSFVMEGSGNCQSGGAEVFKYCSFAKNCIGGCDYCYLQGMMRSGNLLAFANMEDCFSEVEAVIEKEQVSEDKRMLLAVSYDNDVYALEGLFGYVKMWSDFVNSKKRPGFTVEVRTKCGTKSFIDRADPSSGSLVFTWSVSTGENIRRFERVTSTLEARLAAASYALDRGFRVRLALDPVIAAGRDWKEGYRDLCERISLLGMGERLDAVLTGGFRIPADYLKIMRRNAPCSPVAFDTYEVRNGTAGYPAEKERAISEYITKALTKIAGVPEARIFSYDKDGT
ncbi:MAG: hypothetical protein IJS71_09520 [Clostridia bacterium]|nr:hypothetical protein [Clostridia bacterium]